MLLTVIMVVVVVMVVMVYYPHTVLLTLSFLALNLFCPTKWSVSLGRGFYTQLNGGIPSGLETLVCQCQWL